MTMEKARKLKRLAAAINPVGFGMWKKRKAMKDVKRWLDERRKERVKRHC